MLKHTQAGQMLICELFSFLKELFESLEEDYKDVEHLKENIPPHLPQVTVTQNL